MIKTILFDYGGVISPTRDNYKFAEKYHDRFGYSDPLELMHKTYIDWDKALIGEISAHDFWKKVSDELKIDPEELKSLIVSTFPIEKRILDIIDQIHDRYVIVMVSNHVEDVLEKIITENDLRNKFDYFINSYNVRVKKPDPRIFQEVINQTKNTFDECLFIDDVLENIEAARSLGMHTIQFDTFEQFRKEFGQYVEI